MFWHMLLKMSSLWLDAYTCTKLHGDNGRLIRKVIKCTLYKATTLVLFQKYSKVKDFRNSFWQQWQVYVKVTTLFIWNNWVFLVLQTRLGLCEPILKIIWSKYVYEIWKLFSAVPIIHQQFQAGLWFVDRHVDRAVDF